MDTSILEIIERETSLLRGDMQPKNIGLPCRQKLAEIMDTIWDTVFYSTFHPYHYEGDQLRLNLLSIFTDLTAQLEILNTSDTWSVEDTRAVAKAFIAEMHDVKRVMFTDVEAVLNKDPAASSAMEVIASYPSIKAILYYLVAHVLYRLGVPVIPRMITELAHSSTGIDIHPGAVIGEYFAIDHGTGIVIGETCIIGRHVTLYQGVTLGAKGFEYDEAGTPLRLPRHPIIHDNVTVYSNSSILGRIIVGHDSIIGGNVWLTHSVEPYSKITQSTIAKSAAEKSEVNV